VLATLESKGLSPNPPATKRELIRRVYFDLIGLPPTPHEIAAFEQDASPEAYEHLIDHLLASPQYGERWARHWLDVVRYAQSNGYERDAEKPMAWRYRDYIIQALNEDKPFDRFILEQLAGDTIANAGQFPEFSIGAGKETKECRQGQCDSRVHPTLQTVEFSPRCQSRATYQKMSR